MRSGRIAATTRIPSRHANHSKTRFYYIRTVRSKAVKALSRTRAGGRTARQPERGKAAARSAPAPRSPLHPYRPAGSQTAPAELVQLAGGCADNIAAIRRDLLVQAPGPRATGLCTCAGTRGGRRQWPSWSRRRVDDAEVRRRLPSTERQHSAPSRLAPWRPCKAAPGLRWRQVQPMI